MAYTTIDDPSAHFQIKTGVGASNPQSITFDGNSDLQPDMLWWKRRDADGNHYIHDSTRGTNKFVYPDLTNTEGTNSNIITSFDTDGWSTGSSWFDLSSQTWAVWAWKCNGGTTSSNTDGSITSTVQVNSDAGFSIGTYTGNSTSGATVGHGLGVKPDMIITKSRDNPSGAAMNWFVAHKGLDDMAGLSALFLNSTVAKQTASSLWGNTAPTTSVFSLGSNAAVNYTGNDMLFYAFHEVQGYSKFGKYTGNANANGPFIYTGFKPALLIIKNASVVTHWAIVDNKRAGYNDDNYRLYTNLSNAENTSDTNLDILSNGFKIRTADSDFNNGTNIIYAAFAENPFVTSTGIPTTAR